MDNGNGELALVKILRIQDGKLSSLLEWPKGQLHNNGGFGIWYETIYSQINSPRNPVMIVTGILVVGGMGINSGASSSESDMPHYMYIIIHVNM